MKNKKWLWIFLLIPLSIISYFLGHHYLFPLIEKYTNKDKNTSVDREYTECEENEYYVGKEEYSVYYKYIGVNKRAVLKKGVLLDASAKALYDKLPDTLYHFNYGDEFFFDYKGKGTFCTLYASNNTTTMSEDLKKRPEVKNYITYFNLAKEGKVSYADFIILDKNQECGYDPIIEYEDFHNGVFPSFDTPLLSKIPYQIKMLINDFCIKNDYVIDKRSSGTFLSDNFTNLSDEAPKDYVIMLQYNDTSRVSNHYVVLVYSSNSQGLYELIANEDFYGNVIIQTLEKENNDIVAGYAFYKNSEETQVSQYLPIIVKQEGSNDVVLVYNPEFQKISRYEQAPLSVLQQQESEEEY